MPKVSIIIPFNNVENYIEECLNSVINQTLKDIEIILINDASKDNSLSIVKKYTKKDKRIKLLEVKTRQGQGYARNRGIETAQGEYIGFVDSDDFVEPDMFELLYNSAKENNTDITMCQVREYDDLNEKYITSDYYSLSVLNEFGSSVFKSEDTKNNILDINVALWNKVYKREFLLSTGEKFPEGFIYEDLPFFFGTYLKADRINIVWKNLYSYRINRKNSTMQQFNNKILDRPPMVSLTYEKLKAFPFLNDLNMKIQGWIINDLFHRYSLMKENYQQEFFFLMKKVFENLNIKNPEDEYWKKVYHFQGYLLVMNNSFEEFNTKVFNEYMDIHKVEDRLLSKLTNNDEIDKRFNLVYDDINKNYKYTEKIVQDVNDSLNRTIKENNLNTENLFQQKTNQIYNDINEGINSNKQLSYEIKQDLINKNENLQHQIINTSEDIRNLKEQQYYNKESIEKLKTDLQDETNTLEGKINTETSKIYEEINKNIQNTQEMTANLSLNIENNLKDASEKLYNDIKDLSYVQKDNFIELNKEQYNIKNLIENLTSELNKLAAKNEADIPNLKQELKAQINSTSQELNLLINKIEINHEEQIDKLKLQLQEDKINSAIKLKEIEENYKQQIEEQDNKHKKEIENLQKYITQIQADLREEMKSPIKKFIEKYQKKTEK